MYACAAVNCCNINGHLVLTGEAHAQLSLSRLVVLRSLWNLSFHDLRSGWFFLQKDLAALDSCTGIPVLIHWVVIALFHMTAGGFA